MTVFIYGLFDAREPRQFRYVGRTFTIKQRIQSHLRGGCATTKKWVRQVSRSGGIVGFDVLETVLERDGPSTERKWILQHRETVLNDLTALPTTERIDSPVMTIREVTVSHARRVLDYCGGNKKKAARILGIGRQTLYNLLDIESDKQAPR